MAGFQPKSEIIPLFIRLGEVNDVSLGLSLTSVVSILWSEFSRCFLQLLHLPLLFWCRSFEFLTLTETLASDHALRTAQTTTPF